MSALSIRELPNRPEAHLVFTASAILEFPFWLFAWTDTEDVRLPRRLISLLWYRAAARGFAAGSCHDQATSAHHRACARPSPGTCKADANVFLSLDVTLSKSLIETRDAAAATDSQYSYQDFEMLGSGTGD